MLSLPLPGFCFVCHIDSWYQCCRQQALGNSALKADSRIIYLFIYLFIPLQKWRFIVCIFAKADGFFPLKGVSTHDLEDKWIKEKE